MLLAMQQQTPLAPSPGSPSFAGLLAALAAPSQGRGTPWNDEDLPEEAATLSYEHALRANARYMAPALNHRALARPAQVDTVSIFEADPGVVIPKEAEPLHDAAAARAASASRMNAEPEAAQTPPLEHDRGLKSASITIRLSRDECAQLRMRAAEAGLTVSAYMRSCTFETEALRALVKNTLAQLRSEPCGAAEAALAARRPSWRQRLAWVWPRPRTIQGVGGDVARA